MRGLEQLEMPEQLMEKEYFFDEGLGQTIDEHVEMLKQEYPGVKVLTRRDRDGFAIVKTQFRPDYKYDLDFIEKFDPEQAQAEIN